MKQQKVMKVKNFLLAICISWHTGVDLYFMAIFVPFTILLQIGKREIPQICAIIVFVNIPPIRVGF